MPDMMFKALNLTGLDETAEQVRAMVQAVKSEIEAELDSLSYAQPDGIYPDMTVGAVIGADETAQWAERTSAGTGTATVRSVQGAAVGYNQLIDFRVNSERWLKNGAIYYNTSGAGILVDRAGTANAYLYQTFQMVANHIYLQIVDAQCTYGSSGTPQILWYSNVVGSSVSLTETRTVYKTLITPNTAAENRFELRPGSTDATITCYSAMLFDLTAMFGAGNEPSTVAEFERMYPEAYYPYSAPTLKPVQIAGIASTDADGDALDSVEWETQTLRAAGNVRDELTAGELVTRVGERAYQSGDESDTTVRTDGITTYYPLVTPTTTPISPLPMTYRVQQGGAESIIVPEGEISAAPILTIADPVNMSTELALIWAAIEALQASRGSTLANVRNDLEVVSPDEVEAPTMDESQITERKSDN